MAPSLQYSCLENPMDKGAWWATVHGVAKEEDMTEKLTLFIFFLSSQILNTKAGILSIP